MIPYFTVSLEKPHMSSTEQRAGLLEALADLQIDLMQKFRMLVALGEQFWPGRGRRVGRFTRGR